ncbi:TonB-dependent receptor [Novosphingobium sp.]|uniref:TonB-dependent receptor n=1 Tax=Novosphingobium sp. TaxID=1874826 RepID=UPI003D125630
MKKRLNAVIWMATTAFFGVSAHAQQAAPAPVDTSKAAAGRDTGEIIVTAQRRSENVLKVPVSVTVVSGDTLRNNGISSLASVTALAPSLQSSNDDTFSIRGVGTTTFSPTLEPTVSQVIDDVVLGNANFASVPLYDIARVEVLNGPQGLLFGKNASAGLINITTTRPELGKIGGDINVEAVSRYRPGGDGHGITAKADLNIPVGQSSALRISGIYNGQDSIIDYVAPVLAGKNQPNLEQGGVRVKFLSKPVDDLTIYIIGDYFKSSGLGGFDDATLRSFGPGSTNAAIIAQAGVSYGVVPSPTNLKVADDYGNFRDLQAGGISSNIGYRFADGLELTSITAWKTVVSDYNIDSTQAYYNGLDVNNNYTNYNQFSQELRLALPSENRFTGQVGFYYFHSTTHNDQIRLGMNGLPAAAASAFPFCIGANLPFLCSIAPTINPGFHTSNTTFLGQDGMLDQHGNSTAGFGQFSYKFTDTFKLTAGGRFTHDETDIALSQDQNAAQYFVALSGPAYSTSDRVTANNFSFKVGPEWQVTPTTMLYGFYGQGYKGPGFSNVAVPGANLAVSPETSRGGEIGIKGTLLGRMLTYSLSAFYTRFNNLQVQAWDPALQTFLLQNAAVATSKGVDLNLMLRPVRGLTLSGSASFLDAKYNSYTGGACFPTGGPSCYNNGVYNPNGVNDLSGVPTLLSSKFTGDISAEYAYPLSGTIDGLIGADVYHRSSYTTGFSSEEIVPEITRFNAHVGVSIGKFTASIFCKNCFNQIRPVSIGQYPGDQSGAPFVLSTSNTWGYDSIRTIGARIGYKF